MACCLEWRDAAVKRHFRASQTPPKVPWRVAAKLGDLLLEPGEYLFIEQVTDAFVAFLNGNPFPPYIIWRDVTAEVEAQEASTRQERRPAKQALRRIVAWVKSWQ